ncbi:MAG: CobW family GTP-binding protein [Candidatus Limivicinus sp.]|jgi:G3E family GTPase
MTKTDIFSGFLGAGKTTLIRKLIAEAFKGERLVLIENEFGEISIDGGFLRDAGVRITEMNSGCICCTLVGDFTRALKKVMAEYAPDRIIIEPSGVGKLSDVAKAVEGVEGCSIEAKLTVVDAGKCRMFMRNFGEFFNDQVSSADLLVMSRTDTVPEEKILNAAELLRGLNPTAGLISTPWDELSGAQIKEAMEGVSLKSEMERMTAEETDGHRQEDGAGCSCGHDHAADEIFTSWGLETPKKFSENELKNILSRLSDSDKYGSVLRAKGIVDSTEGEWIHFDYVPGEIDVRRGCADVTGRFCVIGSKLDEQALKELFNIE